MASNNPPIPTGDIPLKRYGKSAAHVYKEYKNRFEISQLVSALFITG